MLVYAGNPTMRFDGENDAVLIDRSNHGNHGQIVGRPRYFAMNKLHPLAPDASEWTHIQDHRKCFDRCFTPEEVKQLAEER
jgi:hypothetical protein